LSEAKDLLSLCDGKKQVLRVAQDDKTVKLFATTTLPKTIYEMGLQNPRRIPHSSPHYNGPTTVTDELIMEEALRAAQRALEAGEVPVGAVVVCDDKIVGRGWNRNLTDADPTAHAEIVALREAGQTVGNHRLGDCELFATIEPCAMCAGAMVHARLKRLVYGADDPKAGAVHSVLEVLNHPRLNHRMEVRGGVLGGRCSELLQSFFRLRRSE
jgi:tRNA(adenine34) deaminase